MTTTEFVPNNEKLSADQLKEFRETAIPVEELSSGVGWGEIPIIESGEPLAPLGITSRTDIRYPLYTDSAYSEEHTTSSTYAAGPEGSSMATVFVRSRVADAVMSAEQVLPMGTHIVVFDGYRPLSFHTVSFDLYFAGLQERRPDLSEEDLLIETQKNVSIISDLSRPNPNNTGGAIGLALYKLPIPIEGRIQRIDDQIVASQQDVTHLEIERHNLISQYARLLNFGPQIEKDAPEAVLNYYEKLAKQRELDPQEAVAQTNRRLLFHLMTKVAGLQPENDEWWKYYSPLSQIGAKVAGLPHAEYGATILTAENMKFEQHRRALASRLKHNNNGMIPVANITPTS